MANQGKYLQLGNPLLTTIGACGMISLIENGGSYMPVSRKVSNVWNGWYSGACRSRRITIDWLRSEKITEELILPNLGFTYIARFSNLNLRKGTTYRIFSYDIYAEKGYEKWLIDVTVRARKVLDPILMDVFRRMGITNFGVMLINKEFSKYILKEGIKKEGNKHVAVQITRDDFVYDRIKDIPYKNGHNKNIGLSNDVNIEVVKQMELM